MEEVALLQLVRSAMETMADPVLVTDAQITSPGPYIVYANPAFTRMTGYALDELLGRSVRMLQGPKTDRALLKRFRESLVAGVPFHGQTYNYRKSGEPYLLDWHVSPIRESDGRVTHWVAIQRDVTEQARLQREVLEAGARERRRIGYDLHDSLGQQLSGIAFLCKALESTLIAADLPEAEEMRRIRRLLSEAVEMTRTLSRGLAPIHDDPDSLRNSLYELADGTTRLFRIPCACVAEEKALVEDAGVTDQLYHIAAEAVTNAVKHARASQIVIRLNRTGAELQLVVEDDGVGIEEEISGNGLGLRIMNYRAESIGGHLNIVRNEAKGTRVICSVCLDQ